MTYDPTDFIAGLEELQARWLKRRIHLSGPYRKDWGWVSSDADIDGVSPSFYLGGQWEPKSNHEVMEKSIWRQKLQTTFGMMDANLRRIPALDFPELFWGISFRKGNGQADFHLQILGAFISKGHLKSTRTAKQRLSALGQDLSGMPHGANQKIFKMGRRQMRAETGIAALRLRLAISGTDHEAFVARIKNPIDAIHPPLAA